MNESERRRRHGVIARAAYDLLAEHGYGGASMLRIATAAKASNETLYRWYGNKDGLFRAMVEDNAAETERMLIRALEGGDDPRGTLERVAPVFLSMLLGEKAVLLNRAAAADLTGELGAAISIGGRRKIMPLLERVIARVCAGRDLDEGEATRWFVALLVGDLQVKRIVHECPPLSDEEIARHCAAALRSFHRLIESC